MKISRLGEAPDYRFSLANERTFLAWIRTALGFLAAGVGLDQLAPGLRHAGDSRTAGAAAVSLCGRPGDLWLSALATQRKTRMRLKEDLPYTHSLMIISLMLMIVAVIVMALVLYAG